MCYAPFRFSFLCCFLSSTPGRLARGPLHSQTVYRPAQPQRVAVVGLVKLLHPPDALRQDGQAFEHVLALRVDAHVHLLSPFVGTRLSERTSASVAPHLITAARPQAMTQNAAMPNSKAKNSTAACVHSLLTRRGG